MWNKVTNISKKIKFFMRVHRPAKPPQVFKSRFLRGLESQLIYYFYVLVGFGFHFILIILIIHPFIII